ncbi:MAG: 23S rRNA (adenine(2503)-C(2))-methyltransferase RlmN [Bacteroidales bacterium]|nr:23S rRNA (adenine(2503)-C(2))-methyltransferase RlmN [Bacteroidales bacterium]
MIEKQNIRALNEEELIKWLANYGEKKYRANQILRWLWVKGETSFNKMTDIPKTLIRKLEESFFIDCITIEKYIQSYDSTVKALFKTYDNFFFEGVVIPDEKRATACISTQIGCPIKCKFCATGQLKFQRNLTVGEIFQQVVELNNLSVLLFNKVITNVVVMGMGEPLLNLTNTIGALEKIKMYDKINITDRKITISTIGLPDKILELSRINNNIKIAWSLHSPFQTIRESLIPIAKKYSIQDIIQAFKVSKFKQPITIEYVLIENVNDSENDVKELIKIASQFRCKINLIPFNKIENCDFTSPSLLKIKTFQQKLVEKNFIAIIRKSKGTDINGSCGQLANKFY